VVVHYENYAKQIHRVCVCVRARRAFRFKASDNI
jgi:hypothetical protein